MATGARQTERLAGRVARRALAASAVLHAGRGLAVGAGGAVLLVGLSKLGLISVDWRVLVAAPLAAGALGGALAAVLRRWSLMRAAGEADRALGLKDTLSTGLAVKGDAGFDAWAVENAELAAAAARVRQVVRLRADWWWGVWPIGAAGAVALAVFAPSVDWLERGAARPPVSVAERERSAAQIREVASALEKSTEVGAAASPEDLKALRDIEAELGSGRSRPEEARAAAAAELERVAGKLDDSAAAKERGTQEVQDRLAAAAASEPARAGESAVSGELSRALQRHDLEEAAREAQDLQDRLGTMTPAEREQLAREMDALADKLEAESARAAKESAAREHASPEAAAPQDPTEKPKGEQAAGAAPPPPTDPEAAARARQDESAQERERQALESAREQLKQMERAVRDAARDVREPATPAREQQAPEQPERPRPFAGERDRSRENPAGRNQKQDQGASPQKQQEPKPGEKPAEPSTTRGGQKEGQQDRPSPQGSPSGERQPSEQGQPRPGEQKNPGAPPRPGESPAGEKQGDPKQGDQKQGDPKQGEAQPARGEGQPKPATGDQQGAKPPPRPGSGQPQRPEGSPQGERPGAQPQPGSQQGDQQPGSKPGESAKPGEPPQQQGREGQGSTKPDGQKDPVDKFGQQQSPEGGRGGAQDQPPDAKGMERVARQLQRAAQDARQPQRTREQAERDRKVAQKMMEEMSPEQRDEFARLLREMQNPPNGEPGGPGTEPARPRMASRRADPAASRTDPVDARRAPQGKPSERVIAEWYSDKPIDRDAKGPAPSATEALREAAASADRAIEHQEVPARYSDMVRRVFKKYSDQAPKP